MTRIILTYLILSVSVISSFGQVNMCKKLLSEKELEYIKGNAVQAIKSNPDTCVLKTLKSLTENYVKTSKPIYIETLDCIHRVSDGYLSELFWELGKDLIHNNFNGFFTYVYNNRNDGNTKVKTWFIESASVMLNAEEIKDRESKRQELKKMMLKEASLNSYNKDKLKYLEQLESQFDYNILD